MPRFAKVEESLVLAKQNIEDLNLNKLPNFQVIHFRNDPTLMIVDRDSGLCMDLETHNVYVFDFDDDMAIIKPDSMTFNKDAYIPQDNYNFAVSQFELKLRDIAINPNATMIYKLIKTLEFYSFEPSKEEILSIISSLKYHQYPSTFKVLAENGFDDDGYLDVQHTENIEIEETFFQAQAIYKFKLAYMMNEDKQKFLIFNGDENHNAKARNSYRLVADKPIFKTITNAELENALKSHFNFSTVYISSELKSALMDVSEPRENDIVFESKMEMDFPF